MGHLQVDLAAAGAAAVAAGGVHPQIVVQILDRAIDLTELTSAGILKIQEGRQSTVVPTGLLGIIVRGLRGTRRIRETRRIRGTRLIRETGRLQGTGRHQETIDTKISHARTTGEVASLVVRQECTEGSKAVVVQIIPLRTDRLGRPISGQRITQRSTTGSQGKAPETHTGREQTGGAMTAEHKQILSLSSGELGHLGVMDTMHLDAEEMTSTVPPLQTLTKDRGVILTMMGGIW
mmetsp:Transcript_40933/g.63886  ORF Transcript_40933/g.63886 Transcript_40933/m.63886 type:complete len:235 (-) Transcript_40933:141-845(-)